MISRILLNLTLQYFFYSFGPGVKVLDIPCTPGPKAYGSWRKAYLGLVLRDVVRRKMGMFLSFQ